MVNGQYFIKAYITKKWGGANPLDALLINRYFIKAIKTFGDALRLEAADVNADKKTNPLDALLINRRYIGAIKSFKAGNWLYVKDTVKVAGSNVNYNFNAVCVGDVNGSYPTSQLRLANYQLSNYGTINVKPGEIIDLPVYTTEDIELGAIGLKFMVETYHDTSLQKFKVVNVSSDIDGLIYNLNDQLSTNNEQLISIAWSAQETGGLKLKAGQTVVTLKIQLPVSNYQLSIINYQLVLDPESILADGDGNELPLNLLSIPRIISNLESQFSFSCFPNPFTGKTVISYQLPIAGKIVINVYDILGNLIRNLVNENEIQGSHTVEFQASDLPAGVYFYRIETENESGVGRMVVMK